MKVLLIDDHPLILAALQSVIQGLGDHVKVTAADSGRTAREALVNDPQHQLVLLDLQLGDADGFDLLVEFRTRYPALPIVVISASDRPSDVIRAIDLGAMGFVPKRASNETLFEALLQVLSGGVYLPAVTRAAHDAGMVGLGAGDDRTESDLGLSARQLDVLRWLVDGRPNKDICRVLNLTESTVKTHLAAIFRKLGVNNRTQAVVAVARRGVRLPMSPGDDLIGGA